MFLHAGGVVCRIVIVVVGNERSFRRCQVTRLDREQISMLVLDVGAIVDGSGAIRLTIRFEANIRRPLLVKLDFKIQVKR